MSNYGIRHDPKVITLVILSMLFPGKVSQKILKDSGLDISERTLRRIKEDVRELGVSQLIKDAHRVYLLANIDGFIDSMKLKQNMFNIVTNNNADNFEKIKAAEVIFEIIKETPNLYDPALSESIQTDTDNNSTISGDEPGNSNQTNVNNNAVEADKGDTP